jgi:alpha-methylacyl-CoA racemase
MPPLTTLKILDFTTLLPGPFATMLLADLGADVIHVEAPNRPDLTRYVPPFDGDVSSWHALLNRNKRSLAVDLKAEGAADLIHKLVLEYDIVIEQFRPGVMDRLGVGYEALRAVNPRLIYCAITGYGQTGPYKDWAGHDNNYLALAGVMSHTGRPQSGPLPLGVQVADIGGSYNALVGILAAVIHRQSTGEGQLVDISLFDAAVAWGATAATDYLVGGEDPTYASQRLNGGSFYDFYETSDGRYLSVGSLEPKFWMGFCAAIGRADLVNAGMALSLEEMPALKAEIQREIGQKPLAEWQAIFAPLDVCVEPVLTVSEMVAHPQTIARQLVVDVPKPDGTTQRQIGHPIKFSATPAEYRHIGLPLGEGGSDRPI